MLRCLPCVVLLTLGGMAFGIEPEGQKAGNAISDRELLAHWPLAGDARDRSPHARHLQSHGAIDWASDSTSELQGAGFNGRDTYLELAQPPQLSQAPFSLTAWVNLDAAGDDLPGDLVSQYDPRTRRGFHLSLKTNAGVTTTQANARHLQFGIDNARQSEWTDRGRPGNALLAFALAAHDGQLWAGTCEPGKGEAGRVYRYGGEGKWIDCGAPDRSNAVTALAVFEGKLYAGTGKYRLGGSALSESENSELGGRVLRYEGDSRWNDCGQLPGVEAIGGLVVFHGRLYASSLYKPAGFFRYEGDSRWTALETPGVRVEAMGVYNGHLYATSYDRGRVYRFDGERWTDCGALGGEGENSQTYSFAVYSGRLFVGTWPSGKVYRFEDINRWTDVGRLGEELEVMGMLVHNGRLIAGTLPLAEVYEYDGQRSWRKLTRLDHTPEVKYRRAWTMAEFDGRVYCSTLPSGRIYSCEMGKTAQWSHEFPAGWRHVAAVRDADRLRLYVDGREVAHSGALKPGDYDLSSDAPLRIGFGANDYLHGRLRDVRLYGRALDAAEILKSSAAGNQ